MPQICVGEPQQLPQVLIYSRFKVPLSKIYFFFSCEIGVSSKIKLRCQGQILSQLMARKRLISYIKDDIRPLPREHESRQTSA
ncbi:hypothetical protein BH10CYA1_BH10CYA1_07980 [soil metagenome]